MRHSRSSLQSAGSSLLVEVLDRATAIATLPAELDDLAARALETNIFYESLMLVPALELIDTHIPLTIVCVRNKSGKLLGVIPLVKAQVRRGLPVPVMRNWTHRYCYLGTPLIDATAARPVLEALAQWLESGAAPARGLQWVRVAWNGPFGLLAEQVFHRSRRWAMDVRVQHRALLPRTADLKPAISGKHAKELRRLQRRLSEFGKLDYAAIEPCDDWRPWYEAFLELEASGWKGAEGSAIGARVADREFFRRVMQTAHASQRLQFLQLRLAGRAIAMKFNLRARDTSYSLKIGYDETYAPYSPGVLLELFNISKFAMEPPGILAMDSCAAENHPMINRLWSGRRDIATVTLARKGLVLRTFIKARPLARLFRKTLKTSRTGETGA
jgi:CelD/BcsL family acetyltransferase involved in cellulose biosynthesis